MTTADKLNLNNLINDAISMKNVADNANTPYFDKKISDFAKNAVDNYHETLDTIIGIVNNNKELFFNKNRMAFHHGCFPKYVERGECDSVMAGRMINIVFKITTLKDWNSIVFKDGGYWWYEIEDAEIDIQTIFAYTSDTKLPEYRICSASSLVDRNGNCEYDLNSARTAKSWNGIYTLAIQTRAQTELLLNEFKTALEYKVNTFRSQANRAEQFMDANRSVSEYIKVAI